MFCTILRLACTTTLFILTKHLSGRYEYYSHFTHEKTSHRLSKLSKVTGSDGFKILA